MMKEPQSVHSRVPLPPQKSRIPADQQESVALSVRPEELEQFAEATGSLGLTRNARINKKRHRDDEEEDDDDDDDDDDETVDGQGKPPPMMSSNSSVVARTRLSKWAARLFDPDRPRGLIQPPQVIPLNDEFLKSFGKREKEMDRARGVTFQIDHKIDNEDDDDDRIDNETEARLDSSSNQIKEVRISTTKKVLVTVNLLELCTRFGPVKQAHVVTCRQSSSQNNADAYVMFEQAAAAQDCVDQLSNIAGNPVTVSFVPPSIASASVPESMVSGTGSQKSSSTVDASSTKDQRKVKITNIKYTVKSNELEAICSRFGPISLSNLLSDSTNEELNAGIAYVTYEEAESAQACINGLKQVAGRSVSVCFATSKTSIASHSYKSDTARYYDLQQPDLSTKCYRCGRVGHIAADCVHEAQLKPCQLCAWTGHDFRNCPMRVVCFNCDLPGHMSRDCTSGRVPTRRVCTVCFSTSHHKTQCHATANSVRPPSVQAAVCMSCGRTGHFLCRQLKWFFGLEGVSCSNCGMPGHIGVSCQRPNLETCARNDDLVQQELDRAATVSSVEESIIAANRRHEQTKSQIQGKYDNRSSSHGGGRNNNGNNSSNDNHHHHHHRGSQQIERGRQRNETSREDHRRQVRSVPPTRGNGRWGPSQSDLNNRPGNKNR